jgi:hypothetical protein
LLPNKHASKDSNVYVTLTGIGGIMRHGIQALDNRHNAIWYN